MDEQDQQLPVTLSDQAATQLMSALLRKGMLKDVVGSLDGKEWVTFQQLEQDIQDHVSGHRGRLNITDLQNLTNVDIKYIKTRIMVLVHSKKGEWTLLGDEIIDNAYLDTISREIDQSLQATGWLVTSQLCQTYNLPIHFFNRILDERLGVIIDGTADPSAPGIIYTQGFADEQKAAVRQAFAEIERPTNVASVQSSLKIPEPLFYSILELFIKESAFKGSFKGRRENSSYIPDVYRDSQIDSARTFANQNGYIEYQQLTKLDIPSPREFLRQHCPDFTLLPTCAVSGSAVAAAEVGVEDAIQANSWIDVSSLIPVPLPISDIAALIATFSTVNDAAKTNDLAPIVLETYVISPHFVQSCATALRPYLVRKASGKVEEEDYNEEEDRKEKSAAKSLKGGTKKPKKQSSGAGTSKGENGLSKIEISKQLVLAMPTIPKDLALLLAQSLRRQLSEQYEKIIQSVFLPSASTVDEIEPMFAELNSHALSSSARNQMAVLQRSVDDLWDRVRLGSNGVSLFEDEFARQSLSKHLLRTLCTELLEVILVHQAYAHGFETSLPASSNAGELYPRMTEDVQMAIIAKLPAEAGAAATKIKLTLGEKVVADFVTAFEKYTEVWTDLTFKNSENEQTLSRCRTSLLVQLRTATSPPLVLHLTVLLLFQRYTGTLLEASGKFVPKIVKQLDPLVRDLNDGVPIMDSIRSLQTLIVEDVKSGGGGAIDETLVKKVREIGLAC